MAEAMQMVVYRPQETIFSEDELENLSRLRGRAMNHIVIECVCTDPKYGDTSGRLTVYDDGTFAVICQCSPQCQRGRISPAEFAKHGGKVVTITNWYDQIHVFDKNDDRVKLSETCLLKYHQRPFHRSLRGLTVHRDMFLICTRCRKHRRFTRHTTTECKAYHDALANAKHWICFDMGKRCSEEEERKNKLVLSGCPRAPKCRGCLKCNCFGCFMCRFRDCDCRECLDYCRNNKIPG